MTEQEWLACRDPDALLEYLRAEAFARRRPHPGRRRLRLFACACCRRVWPCLADPRSRRAVEVAERYADRLATRQELALAFRSARALDRMGNAGAAAAAAASPVCRPDRAAAQAALAGDVRRWAAERAAQADLLRDVFGNPFRPPPAPDPAWRGAVRDLARSVYDGRAFDRLPLLADALEKAGCADEAVLGHCRQPAEHALGCWLVDAILGKR